jgi:hypothetical protein
MKPDAYFMKRRRRWYLIPLPALTAEEREILIRELGDRERLDRAVARLTRSRRKSRNPHAPLAHAIADAFLGRTPAGYVAQGVSVDEQIAALRA